MKLKLILIMYIGICPYSKIYAHIFIYIYPLKNVMIFFLIFLFLVPFDGGGLQRKGRLRNQSYPQGTEWYLINENSSLYEVFILFIYQIMMNNTYEKTSAGEKTWAKFFF